MHSKLIFLVFFVLFFTGFVFAAVSTAHNSTIQQVYVYKAKTGSKDVFSEIAPAVLFAIGAVGLYLFALR